MRTPLMCSLAAVASVLVTIMTCVNAMAIKSTAGGNGTVTPHAALGGFAQTCSSWSGFFGTDANGKGVAVLVASCFTATGGSRDTVLDLNTCVSNDDGHLNCRVK